MLYHQRLVFEYVRRRRGKWFRRLVGLDNARRAASSAIPSDNTAIPSHLSLTLKSIRLDTGCVGVLLRDAGLEEVEITLAFLLAVALGALRHCRRLLSPPDALHGAPSRLAKQAERKTTWVVIRKGKLFAYQGSCSAQTVASKRKGAIIEDDSNDSYYCCICLNGIAVRHLGLEPIVGEEPEDGVHLVHHDETPKNSGKQSHKSLTTVVTPCNHVYHQHCLKKWTRQRNICPLCQKGIPPIDFCEPWD